MTAYEIEADHWYRESAEEALWCAVLALMLDDARRYHHGKDKSGAGRAALADVLNRGPMLRHVCRMLDRSPDWVARRFAESLQ